MDADKINDIIDNAVDIGDKVLVKFLLQKALISIIGTTTGPWAFVISFIIRKVLDATVGEIILMVKREGQYQIDIAEGKMIIKKTQQAVEDGNENDYIDAIGEY